MSSMTCCGTAAACGWVEIMGRRVLITGVDRFWGGRMAQALEQSPDVDVIIAMGTREPTVALERTEFVRADQAYSILSRIVRATQVDTVVHTFLIVNSGVVPARRLHEINVIGTMNLLAACGTSGNAVRQVVVKSSSLVYGSSYFDPTWFREQDGRNVPARTAVERSLLEVESFVRDFAEENPHIVVSVLRFGNVLGADIVTPLTQNLSRPLVPAIAGYDPMMQFMDESDVVRALTWVTEHELPGLYNVAGKGRMPWSEVVSMCGRRILPLPPMGTASAAALLSKVGLISFPPELEDLLRYGRGLDTSRIAQAGFRPVFTTAGAVKNFARAMHLKATIGDAEPEYRYDPHVETFFRHSPAVVRDR